MIEVDQYRSAIHQMIYTEYDRLLTERRENPQIDNSDQLELLHQRLNKAILDDIGMDRRYLCQTRH